MSLTSNITMLNSALRAFQYGLNTTSSNIANIGTAGYSRQVLGLQTLPSTFDGSLALGSGVNATSINRVRDIFLDSRIKFELSELGRSTAEMQVLTELAAIFPEVAASGSTAGLKGAIDTVVSKWTALAAAPASVTAKTDVREALRNLAVMLQVDARKTFDLQMRVDRDIQLTISDINDLLDQIASINTQLKALPGSSMTGAPNVLLDLREQAAEKLAKLIDVDFRITGDGSMSVSTGVGTLVQGGNALHLIGIASTTDPGRTAIGFSSIQGSRARDITASIQGGKLGGLLNVRDTEIERARLDLDRIAYGIISRSNEINRTYVASDGTTQHDLFIGTRAADIALNPIVDGTVDYVGGTRHEPLASGPSDPGDPGDLARIQAELKNFIQYSSIRSDPGFSLGGGNPFDPNISLTAQSAIGLGVALVPTTPASQGRFRISTGGNAIAVDWDQSMTLNEIIDRINLAGAGAFYATFDDTTDKVIVVGETPLTVYDETANLMEVLAMSSVVTSSAPLNNYPLPGANQVDPVGALDSVQNKLNLFTTALSTGGTILIDGTAINWTTADQIQISLAINIQASTPVPRQVGLAWNAADQTISLVKSGDSAINPGAHNNSLGNTMAAIQIVDQAGNLSRALNIDTNTNSTNILDELVVKLGSRKSAESVLVQQAQALVDQTQQLIDAESGVDLNAELAQARLYQRSYEASVRMQFILDEILNTLINHTGSSASGSSAI